MQPNEGTPSATPDQSASSYPYRDGLYIAHTGPWVQASFMNRLPQTELSGDRNLLFKFFLLSACYLCSEQFSHISSLADVKTLLPNATGFSYWSQ